MNAANRIENRPPAPLDGRRGPVFAFPPPPRAMMRRLPRASATLALIVVLPALVSPDPTHGGAARRIRGVAEPGD